jgi:hypothetical protein
VSTLVSRVAVKVDLLALVWGLIPATATVMNTVTGWETAAQISLIFAKLVSRQLLIVAEELSFQYKRLTCTCCRNYYVHPFFHLYADLIGNFNVFFGRGTNW